MSNNTFQPAILSENNHFIGCTTATSCWARTTNLTNTTSLGQTNGVANGFGYVAGNFYAPTDPTDPTVGDPLVDPHIQLGGIYGSNERYIMNAIPHIGNLLDAKLEGMLSWADHVIVAQNPSADALARLEASGKPLLDLVGQPFLAAAGFQPASGLAQ
jgi:hypothetical protein